MPYLTVFVHDNEAANVIEEIRELTCECS
jgi:hypothetical protein